MRKDVEVTVITKLRAKLSFFATKTFFYCLKCTLLTKKVLQGRKFIKVKLFPLNKQIQLINFQDIFCFKKVVTY